MHARGAQGVPVLEPIGTHSRSRIVFGISGILSWEQPIISSGPALPIRFTITPADGVPASLSPRGDAASDSEMGMGPDWGRDRSEIILD